MHENYKNLIVWQKSMDLVVEVYTVTAKYPPSELYGLSSQSRRAAISIPSNIAEGRRRNSEGDFARFLSISFASGAELETQIGIAKRLPWGEKIDFSKLESLLEEVMKMLNKLLHKQPLHYQL